MKIHRNRKEYGCSECGKSFNQRVAYNMHVRIHTGVKPHQCDQCGKAFSRKMLLKQHLRTHSGERPYQCQICHKAFADRSNMTLHTRLHSGLKPYQCTLCSKAFTKKHHLKTHLNYHTGTKPYSCPNCSLRFSQSSNMRTHYKKCCSMAGIEGFDRHDPTAGSEQKNQEAGAQPTNSLLTASGVEAPSVGARTNALTPPNSDQESSIQTPTKINQAIALRSTCRPRKIDINVILDTWPFQDTLLNASLQLHHFSQLRDFTIKPQHPGHLNFVVSYYYYIIYALSDFSCYNKTYRFTQKKKLYPSITVHRFFSVLILGEIWNEKESK